MQITLPAGFDKTQWHHLAVTVNADDVAGGYKVYLDGNVVGTFAMDGTYGNFINPQHPRLGSAYNLASNTWYNMDGKIDDVQFFNHALSWQEVEWLYCGQWDRADINADCSVNLGDLYQLVQNWLVVSAENIDGDVDGNGRVDLSDLAILANSWMQSKNP